MTAGYPAIIADAEVWEAEPTSDLASHPVLYVRDDHLLVDDVAVSPDAQRPGMGTVCSTSPTDEHEQPPDRGAAPHQRSDDGDPRLLPAARLPRELPGRPRRLPTRILCPTLSTTRSAPNPNLNANAAGREGRRWWTAPYITGEDCRWRATPLPDQPATRSPPQELPITTATCRSTTQGCSSSAHRSTSTS